MPEANHNVIFMVVKNIEMSGEQQSTVFDGLKRGLAALEGGLNAFSPYAALGDICRVPHYNRYGVSMTRLLRRDWLMNTPMEKRQGELYFIRDDGAIVDNAAEALNEGYKVELVTGPKLKDAETREKLAGLLQQYGAHRLSICSCSDRPDLNVALINGNLMYEDKHAEGDDYDTATSVERADQYNIQLIINRVNTLQVGATLKDTLDKVRQMPTIRE